MTKAALYSQQAELALAAYANLKVGVARAAYEAALRDEGRGMSVAQAERFAERWRVVDQYNDSDLR
ncbi:MAG: hypothetical protein FJY54_14830 [Betaproteobacteria bacterium]|nr:hypothetical protein [Betaproteobacteria bacterium]